MKTRNIVKNIIGFATAKTAHKVTTEVCKTFIRYGKMGPVYKLGTLSISVATAMVAVGAVTTICDKVFDTIDGAICLKDQVNAATEQMKETAQKMKDIFKVVPDEKGEENG